MSELFEEIKKDEVFVEKVADRIYSDSDNFEDSMPEPEWICEMTDIADKYIRRFKFATKNKRSSQPSLNENQQKWFSRLKANYKWHGKSAQHGLYATMRESDLLPELPKDEFAQVLQAFSQWVLEQEESNENNTSD